jgi:subtilisin family serine protease
MLSFILMISLWISGDPVDRHIAPSLLANGMEGQHQSFLILLKDQANVNGAYQIRGKEAKGRYVFQKLKETAQKSQSSVLDMLQREGVPYQSFFVANMIKSHGSLQLIRTLAAHPDVAYICADSPVMLEQPGEDNGMEGSLRSFESVTWGIGMIGADKVWEMGFTGEDVVVGGQDTGYEWDHPAIQHSYRGWQNGVADHNYNWHDAIYEIDPLNNDSIIDPSNNPCGLQSEVPCDDNNHGTHTMGTMAGIDSVEQFGVAPDSKWIGCRNMERGWGKPSTYIECFEWFIAPTDLNHENPDPDKAPHVIANSWTCPPVEGCDPSNFAIMELVVDNLKAAGVVVVVSAGNNGSGCSSVSNPAAIFSNSYTIGATRQNDTLANFSSRGPVTVDGSNRLKPDVVAPGVQVLSAIRNGGYARFNGTSMAGPHVAGAVALIISARPDLAGEVDEIIELINTTAIPKMHEDTCGEFIGTDIPNAAYGWGRIDVHAAVVKALESVSVTSARQPLAVKLFPNPFRHDLFLRLTEPSQEEMDFVLYDIAGRLVWRQSVGLQTGGITYLNIPELMSGVYFWQLQSGTEIRASGQVQRM